MSHVMMGAGAGRMWKDVVRYGYRMPGIFGWATPFAEGIAQISKSTIGSFASSALDELALPQGVRNIGKEIGRGAWQFFFGFKDHDKGYGAFRLLSRDSYSKLQNFSNVLSQKPTIAATVQDLGDIDWGGQKVSVRRAAGKPFSKVVPRVAGQRPASAFAPLGINAVTTHGIKMGGMMIGDLPYSMSDIASKIGVKGSDVPWLFDKFKDKIRGIESEIIESISKYRGSIFNTKGFANDIVKKYTTEIVTSGHVGKFAVGVLGKETIEEGIRSATTWGLVRHGIGIVLTPLSTLATGYFVADLVGDLAYGVSNAAFETARRMSVSVPALEFGGAFVGSRTGQARTERQSALAAIQRTRANGMRTIGNEAALSHIGA
jgi:hypothetical protein